MSETTQNTFRNLMLLMQVRQNIRDILKNRYYSVVQPHINIIEKVAAANNESHFDAIDRIRRETDWLQNNDKMMIFAAALMEIVEEKNLQVPVV